MKKNFLLPFWIVLFFLLSFTALVAQENGEFEIFTDQDASYSVTIPREVTERSTDPNRITWTVLPVGASSPLSVRINHIFIGVAISHDEYMSILEESKRNEGMETQKVDVKNGRAFVYETKARRSDDETQTVYMVALSDKGWICTLTFTGKGSVLKKERSFIKSVMDSFEFLADKKKR
jgi:hypothetical protein